MNITESIYFMVAIDVNQENVLDRRPFVRTLIRKQAKNSHMSVLLHSKQMSAHLEE